MTALNGAVLVVAEDLDPTADLVVEALADRRVPVVRFDLARFPMHLDLMAEHDSSRPGWGGELSTGTRSVQLEEVRAVYYRRPGLPVISAEVGWRSDYDALEYEPVAVPEQVAVGVKE